jgi:hypothetical protein
MIIPMSIIGFAGLFGGVSAKIPFDFMVGGKKFKAGKYTVSRLYADNPAGTLIIRGVGNVETAYFNTNDVVDKDERQHTRLIFHRYGEQYFLAEIFDGYSGHGCGILKSKAEREAAKNRDTITQSSVQPETVTVGAQIGQ